MLGAWTGHAELREPPRGGPWRSPKRAIQGPKMAEAETEGSCRTSPVTVPESFPPGHKTLLTFDVCFCAWHHV